MPNPKKIKLVEALNEKFAKAKAIYFTDYKGMDVETTNNLRSEFFKNDIDYKVAKVTLTKRAAEQAGYKDVDQLIDGQMAIAFTYDDPVIPAKLITQFAEDNELETFRITGCIFEDEYFGQDRVDQIKDLPTRDELMSKFVATLNAPMAKLVRTLNASMSNFVNVLKALKDSKEE
ncbi:MAG: 50S ribosomal protein L10 [Candidatus Marinimicrobia bacterium]|nr:50S ribosomal protein L10 [Candidatus Neomarinimicrobiota bacterium]